MELKLRKRLKNQTKSRNEFTKIFTSTMLELGNRVPDEGAVVFTYIDGVKEDV